VFGASTCRYKAAAKLDREPDRDRIVRYISTRGEAPSLGFIDVTLAGLARDGGLYVPEAWPRLDRETIAGFAGRPYAEVAVEVLRAFAGGGPADVPDRYRAASPVARVSGASPPTITVLGRRDRIMPADQAATLDAALARAGVARETLLLRATDHGFDLNWGGFGTQLARVRIGRFLAEHS